MHTILSLKRPYLAFLVTLLLLIALMLISKSEAFVQHATHLSIGITADLLLIIPFVYFLLIRKTTIPKTTVIPILVAGMIMGFYILPPENQYYLSIFKSFALPCIELAVLSFIIYKVRKAMISYQHKKDKGKDFFNTLVATCSELLPKALVMPFATEVAVFYYGFIAWGSKKLNKTEFTHHKESGSIAIFSVFIFIILVETFVIHLLLVRWSEIAAWIISSLSIYTALQVWGMIKSIPKRPITIGENELMLRYGILNETSIKFDNILTIEPFTKAISKEDNIITLSPLGELESYNLLIHLKSTHTLKGLYGIKKKFNKLAFHVDKKEEFLSTLNDLLNK